MRKILENIFLWEWFSEDKGYNFNGHLICHTDGNLCIDPVEPGEALDELTRLGAKQILLTNRNHSRAANLVRERTGAKTAIHPDDAVHARNQGTELDGSFRVGDKIGPLVVIGASGKSPGEVAFHWPDRKILIVGDAIIGNPPGSCGLLNETVMDDPAQLKQSVRDLLEIDFETLLVGDGKPIVEDAKRQLEALVNSMSK